MVDKLRIPGFKNWVRKYDKLSNPIVIRLIIVNFLISDWLTGLRPVPEFLKNMKMTKRNRASIINMHPKLKYQFLFAKKIGVPLPV